MHRLATLVTISACFCHGNGHAARLGAAPSVAYLHTRTPRAQLFLLQDSSMAKRTAAGGHLHTRESRAKISAANKGKTPWNVGKAHSEETRRRIAEGTRRAVALRKEQQQRERAALRLSDPAAYALLVANESAKATRRVRRGRGGGGRRAPPNVTRAAAPRKAAARGGRVNFTFTEEAKARISASLRARWADPEYRQRRGNVTVSEETRAKLSRVMKAKWRDGEYRKRCSVNGSHTVERRRKISEAIRKKWADPSYRNRTLSGIRAAHSNSNATVARTKIEPGSPEDIEWRRRISAGMKARWRDDEYRQSQLERMSSRGPTSSRPPPRQPSASRAAAAPPAPPPFDLAAAQMEADLAEVLGKPRRREAARPPPPPPPPPRARKREEKQAVVPMVRRFGVAEAEPVRELVDWGDATLDFGEAEAQNDFLFAAEPEPVDMIDLMMNGDDAPQ